MNQNLIVTEDGALLYSYLRNELHYVSKNNVKSLLSKRKVVVNGTVQTQYDYKLKKNDVIEIRNTVVSSPFSVNLPIIYEDRDFLVVDKPSGMLSVATEKQDEKKDNLFDILTHYVQKKNSKQKLFVVHRLDQDTSGVILFSKNEKLKKLLQDSWNESVTRIYYAVVEGKTKKKETLTSYLQESKNLRTYSSSSGKLAITHYEAMKENGSYSLLKILIDTGRRNQIRVQLADIGHPIVGDSKYGRDSSNRLMLHAHYLEIIHPITKEKMSFSSSVPESFYRMLEKN